LHRTGRRAEGAEVDAHVAQPGVDAGQGEVLRSRDRYGGLVRAPDPEAPDAGRLTLGDKVPASPSKARLQDYACSRSFRPAAGGEPPGREVSDVHTRGGVAGVAQRERSGKVAWHEVVTERGQQRAAGGARARPVALEHLTDERPLAGGVEVGRAGGDRRLDCGLAVVREWPHGGDENVAAVHESADGVGTGGVGDRGV
jgi:hypothetical protein